LRTLKQRTRLAPVLSATSKSDSCWIMISSHLFVISLVAKEALSENF
jgi:hypothetical protein